MNCPFREKKLNLKENKLLLAKLILVIIKFWCKYGTSDSIMSITKVSDKILSFLLVVMRYMSRDV